MALKTRPFDAARHARPTRSGSFTMISIPIVAASAIWQPRLPLTGSNLT